MVALNIHAGQWHTVRALESGFVILEMKDGAYEPIGGGGCSEFMEYLKAIAKGFGIRWSTQLTAFWKPSETAEGEDYYWTWLAFIDSANNQSTSS